LKEKGNSGFNFQTVHSPFFSREERIKRTQDIAENAAAEIRDSNEVNLFPSFNFLKFVSIEKMERITHGS